MGSQRRKVVIVGAGPVGCLSAMSFAKQGWEVEVYEGRPDIRLPSSKAAAQQRSINLAISARGLTAIRHVDSASADRFLETVIPMRGRMIHGRGGKQQSLLYDRDGQCINSIDRAIFNEGLLNEAYSNENIRVFFKHKVQALDFDGRNMVVRDLDKGQDITVAFDLCIGADGSYSVVRRQMMRVVRMDFQQEYIPHEYLELKMPPGRDSDGQPRFLLDPNHLHIWPRHSFMLIALPNKDKSFTCTLFAPTAEFDQLNDRDTVLAWFKRQFPDALDIIGEDNLVRDFQRNPRSALISTKSKPYHYKDRAILLGDAAHSMVPFFGQGLNCGLEDVRVLATLLHQAGVNSAAPTDGLSPPSRDSIDPLLADALSRYSATRHADLVAICDLAMHNYVEMRHDVTTPAYLLRKAVDDVLSALSSRTTSSIRPWELFPAGDPPGWLPLYTMVTFRPDISYAAAKGKAERQSRILTNAGWASSVILGAGVAYLAFRKRFIGTR